MGLFRNIWIGGEIEIGDLEVGVVVMVGGGPEFLFSQQNRK